MKGGITTLIRRDFTIFSNKKIYKYKFLYKISTILKPVVLAFILYTIIDMREAPFYEYSDTKNIIFVIACSAIFLGVFNSLQEISSDRAIVKKELGDEAYSPLEYSISKLIKISMISIYQSFILCIPVYFNLNNTNGAILPSLIHEIYLTTFLVLLTSGSLGLMLSSLSKNVDSTMNVMPIFMLAQFLFSGVIFGLDNTFMKIASYFTLSKWAMVSYGTSINLNTKYQKIQNIIPQLMHEIEKDYFFTAKNLLQGWGMLALIFVISFFLTVINIKDIVNDAR